MKNSLNPDQVVVPILGMHRSGTSMFTRALNLLGLELGDSLMPPATDNTLGFWEDMFFVSNNMEILRFVGSNSSGIDSASSILKISQQCANVKCTIDCHNNIKKYIKGMFKSSKWGWKDPRTVVLFQFWVKILRNLGYKDLRPVIIVRNPLGTVRSLVKQGHLASISTEVNLTEEKLALDVWKIYNQILLAISETTLCYISFYEWLIDPKLARDELKRCAHFIGLDIENMDAALKWIDPSMVHHHFNIKEIGDNEAIDVFEQLKLKADKQRDESRF